MFCYEMKKIFGFKECLGISIFLMLTIIYSLYGMIYRSATPGIPEPFLDFLGFADILAWVVNGIVIFIVSSLYPVELETGMAPLLLASKYGETNIRWIKLAVTLVVTNLFVIIRMIVIFLGCLLADHLNFSALVSEEYALELTMDPMIKTYGNILSIQMIGFVLATNFIAIFCLLLSIKIKKSFVSAIVCALICFVPGLIPESVPVLGIIGDLFPMCLASRASTYQVIFQSDIYACTILHVGFLAYIFLIVFMIVGVTKIER